VTRFLLFSSITLAILRAAGLTGAGGAGYWRVVVAVGFIPAGQLGGSEESLV